MSKAVKFERYGGPEVLQVVEVPKPVAAKGQVVVRAVAAGVNPGERMIASGAGKDRFPAHFPEGQGSDLAGMVDSVGDGVDGISVGDPVIGFSDGRNTQAEYVLLEADRVIPKPDGVDWAAAASLFVAGTTAWAMIEAVQPKPGETVVVAGAAGGVGFLVSQLAKRAGARVLGTASEHNHDALRGIGVEPLVYGEGLEQRIRDLAPDGVDCFIDTYGDGNIELALRLGVAKDRIDTIADFAGAQRHGIAVKGMSAVEDPADAMTQLAALVAAGDLQVPIKARFPLDQVQDAYRAIAERSGLGKIVLDISAP